MITNEWVQNTPAFQDAKAVRLAVFVEEQNIDADSEFDDIDTTAQHLVLYDNGTPCAAGRVYITQENIARPGRICVLKSHRGQHLGDLLMRMLIQKSVAMGARELELSAQVHARGFYEKFGFKAENEPYMEEGIPHIKMSVNAEDILMPRLCDNME